MLYTFIKYNYYVNDLNNTIKLYLLNLSIIYINKFDYTIKNSFIHIYIDKFSILLNNLFSQLFQRQTFSIVCIILHPSIVKKLNFQ